MNRSDAGCRFAYFLFVFCVTWTINKSAQLVGLTDVAYVLLHLFFWPNAISVQKGKEIFDAFLELGTHWH